MAQGDSIWTMAEANMPGEPTNQEVAEYVDLVADTNRGTGCGRATPT